MTSKWKISLILFACFLSGGIAACDDSRKGEELDSETEFREDSENETDSADSYRALSQSLFVSDDIMEVKVEIDGADWDLLRYEAPNIDHFSNADCPFGPRPRPFNWYDASVSVNGESFGEIEVRKKGLLGSMDPMRPSLKFNFKKEHLPGGIELMTLNNAVWEFSYSREYLTYHLFRKAGIAAPRSGFAKVTINGKDMGIFTHIEEIKPPMLSLYYGADASDGDLFEITTADFTDELEVVFEPKGDDTDAVDTAALHKITEALKADDDTLFEKLGESLDLDKFFTYWAMEVITAHWDGYSGQRNNSFLYRNPKTGLFEFIPWGTDGDWEEPVDFFGQYSGAYDTMPWSLYAHGAICRRLINHPEGRVKYKETLLRLLDTVWDENELLDIVDTIQLTVRPSLKGDIADANQYETAYLRSLIQSHKQDILDEIDADSDWPSWDRPVNPPHCADEVRTFFGTLTTSFESLDADIIETGTGEVTDDDGSTTTEMTIVRGRVGTWQNIRDEAFTSVEIAFGPVSDMGFAVVAAYFPSELFYEGNTILLNYGEGLGTVLTADMVTGETADYGFVATGRLTIEALDPTPGGEVRLFFEAKVGRFRL